MAKVTVKERPAEYTISLENVTLDDLKSIDQFFTRILVDKGTASGVPKILKTLHVEVKDYTRNGR